MNRVRKKAENQFTQISNTFINDSNISFKAKGIFVYLWSKPDKWKIVIRDIENHGREKERAIRAAFKELKDNGYMNWVAVQSGWDYFITDTPNSFETETKEEKEEKPAEEDQYLDISNGFIEIMQLKLNKTFTKSILEGWKREIRLLIDKDLKNRKNASKDVISAIQSISDNYGKEFFPVIESGRSLRDKITKIENYIIRNTKKTKTDRINDIFSKIINKEPTTKETKDISLFN